MSVDEILADKDVDGLSVREMRCAITTAGGSTAGLLEKAELRARVRELRGHQLLKAFGRVAIDARRPLGDYGVVAAPIAGAKYEALMKATPSDLEAFSAKRLRNYVFVAHHAFEEPTAAKLRRPSLEDLGDRKSALVAEAKRCRAHIVEQWNVASSPASNRGGLGGGGSTSRSAGGAEVRRAVGGFTRRPGAPEKGSGAGHDSVREHARSSRPDRAIVPTPRAASRPPAARNGDGRHARRYWMAVSSAPAAKDSRARN